MASSSFRSLVIYDAPEELRRTVSGELGNLVVTDSCLLLARNALIQARANPPYALARYTQYTKQKNDYHKFYGCRDTNYWNAFVFDWNRSLSRNQRRLLTWLQNHEHLTRVDEAVAGGLDTFAELKEEDQIYLQVICKLMFGKDIWMRVLGWSGVIGWLPKSITAVM